MTENSEAGAPTAVPGGDEERKKFLSAGYAHVPADPPLGQSHWGFSATREEEVDHRLALEEACHYARNRERNYDQPWWAANMKAALLYIMQLEESATTARAERDEWKDAAENLSAECDRWADRIIATDAELATARAVVQQQKEILDRMKGWPWAFMLRRDEDVSGVSGTGVVAEGVEFSDGTVALRWISEWPTSVVFHDRGLEAVKAVHGHDGRTQIVMVPPAAWEASVNANAQARTTTTTPDATEDEE